VNINMETARKVKEREGRMSYWACWGRLAPSSGISWLRWWWWSMCFFTAPGGLVPAFTNHTSPRKLHVLRIGAQPDGPAVIQGNLGTSLVLSPVMVNGLLKFTATDLAIRSHLNEIRRGWRQKVNGHFFPPKISQRKTTISEKTMHSHMNPS
jgi:hypothetical protein